MKILHVLMAPRAEGTPRLVLDWLKVTSHHEQEIVFLSEEGELKAEFDRTSNWKYYNRDFVPRLKSLFKMRALMKRITTERKPDMVISWMTGFSPWVLWGAHAGGARRLIAHCGNAPGNRNLKMYVYSYMSFWILNLLKGKAICCSVYIKDAFCAIPLIPKSIFFSVYNCINPDRFHSSALETSVGGVKFIMVATMENHKDHITLLKAWQMVETEHPEAKLTLVGSGTLEIRLKERAAQLQLKHVMFLGSRNDVPDLLTQSDCFIFSTTYHEGFGTVLIEALASGLQIIATDVPACREVLQQGEYGELVSIADPTSLYHAIKKQIDIQHDTQRDKRIAYARQFTATWMMDQYMNISLL